MSITVNLKKTIIIVAVILVAVGCVWRFVATEDERKARAQYKQLEKFANRQAVEIAVIEQAARLQQLKRAIKKAQMKVPPANSEVPDIAKE